MRTAIYARVSTPGQAQAQTIEQQLLRLRAHIKEKHWSLEPEHVFVDNGYSGAKLSRPGLDSLRDRAALAEFDVVLVTEPDRLARNYVHQMLVLEELEKLGIAKKRPISPMLLPNYARSMSDYLPDYGKELLGTGQIKLA